MAFAFPWGRERDDFLYGAIINILKREKREIVLVLPRAPPSSAGA